jgi:hypothetical protein
MFVAGIEEVNYSVQLRCPLAYTRMSIPAKGKNCQHQQCFDMSAYVQFSMRQQLWHCPICHNAAAFVDLLIDDFFCTLLDKYKSGTLKSRKR